MSRKKQIDIVLDGSPVGTTDRNGKMKANNTNKKPWKAGLFFFIIIFLVSLVFLFFYVL